MTTDFKREGGILTVAISGRLDTVTSPELEKSLNDNLNDVNELVLDFSSVEYISSTGLRVLLSLQKKMAKLGGMKVLNVNEMVKSVFDVTGFSDVLTIE